MIRLILPAAAAAWIALAPGCSERERERRPTPSGSTDSPDPALEHGNEMVQRADECLAQAPTAARCQRACELNHSNSCARWGEAAERGGDRNEALSLYARACRGGSGIGCDGAARLTQSADPAGSRRFAEQARQYHRVHCEQGYVASCVGLSEMFRTGRGGPVDAAVAAHYRRRACTLGSTSACQPAR